MNNSVYIAETIPSGIDFIKANTDWRPITNVSFKNGDEHVVVISQFVRIRGRKFKNIYIDSNHYKNREWDLFAERIFHLGVEPKMITQK